MTNCTPPEGTNTGTTQLLESSIRAMREAQVEQLDFAVAQALSEGIPLKEMRIVEVTEWETERKFSYEVKVSRRK